MIKTFLNNKEFNVTDVNKTMVTCIIYDFSIDNLTINLHKHLEKIQNIKHPKTKKLLNDRINSLIDYIDSWDRNETINKIFLINDSIYEHKLSKKDVSTLREFKKKNVSMLFDNNFKIEYLIDFFTNFNYYNVFECNKLSVDFVNMTVTKYKKIKTRNCKNDTDVNKFIEDNINKSPFLIHGSSTLLKNYQSTNQVIRKRLMHEEIMDEIEKKEIAENHKKLEEVFEYFDDERKLHLLLYGKIINEIKDAIEQYKVKELYCHVDRLHIVKKQLPAEYYNFSIIIIKKLKDGDISDKLLNDYRGVLGITYY
jgi:hypothetical protein